MLLVLGLFTRRAKEKRVYIPWNAETKLRLNSHKPGEYSQAYGRGSEHDDDPDVELEFGPVVATARLRVGATAESHFGVDGLVVER